MGMPFDRRSVLAQKRGLSRALAGCLLLVMIAEVALSVRQESPSWDEGDHIYSGYMNWLHDEYDLNPEHPPLVKLVATLPLLGLKLKVPPRQGRYFKDEAYYGGHALLFGNSPRYSADTLLFRVHMAALVFGLTLAVLLFAAGSEMFGPLAGLVAMALFVFDPTVLANAPFVATDTGAACGFFASVYLFYRFVKQMTWRRAAACGLVTGLALATKHSAVLLLPILLLLAAGDIFGRTRPVFRGRDVWRAALRMLAGMAGIAALAVLTLWSVYSFRFAMAPNGVKIPTLASRSSPPIGPAMRWAARFCDAHHLLPQSYIYGLIDVQRVGLWTPSFVLGQIHAHGVWYYFPLILSLKWTAGMLGLLALATGAFVTGRVRRPREVWFLALPALFYLAVAMAGPLNIGVRHVLPIFPFAFALIGGGVAWLLQQKSVWMLPVAALAGWHVVDSVRMFPNYLPYANVLWGGPANTHLYFSDSATDWGQQLKWTKEWLDARGVKQCWFAYFPAPFLLPSDYGIPCNLLPTADTEGQIDIDVPPVVHGPVLVSYSDLDGYEYGSKLLNPYEALSKRKPDAVIADGIAVFYGDFQLPDAEAVEFVQRAARTLKSDPKASLAAAKQAVALAPDGLAEDRALGDAEAANGDKAAARTAYMEVMRRLPEMEPSQRAIWQQAIEARLAALGR